jgi:hypothetical protein
MQQMIDDIEAGAVTPEKLDQYAWNWQMLALPDQPLNRTWQIGFEIGNAVSQAQREIAEWPRDQYVWRNGMIFYPNPTGAPAPTRAAAVAERYNLLSDPGQIGQVFVDQRRRHYYPVLSPRLCAVGTPGCTYESLYAALLSYQLPGPRGAGTTVHDGGQYPIYGAPEPPFNNVAVGAGSVVVREFPEAWTVVNITLDAEGAPNGIAHMFDPGYVARTIVEVDGYFHVQTIGEGVGPSPFFNKYMGSRAVRTLDRAFVRYLRGIGL